MHRVVMALMKEKFFHDTRKNLNVYENYLSILLARNREGIYWTETLYE
jgi:hypothetical protein